MATTRISVPLRELVRQRAGHRCEYCQVSEWLSGQRCHIDHIIPLVEGGETSADNLCLACAACNGSKLDRTEAVDSQSGERGYSLRVWLAILEGCAPALVPLGGP